jgi:hypothetical protein
MIDALTIQAEAEARIDALTRENATLRARLDCYESGQTIPAPPLEDELPSPLAAIERMRGPCEQ